MESMDDSALLRQYREKQSEDAFATLVTRYINLVYSVALRQLGNPQQAEEVTQAVFILLAKKAGSLRHEKALSSWLFRTAHLVAKNFVRSEMRRHHREQEAFMQSPSNEADTDAWQQMSPLLDTAVAALGEKDRQAILLRFFQKKSLSDVGMAAGIGEEAAKKRVSRALEKLRKFFAKRGVNSTTTIIGENISAHSVQAAPVALAKAVAAVAVAKGVASSASTLTLVKGALKIMAWTKAKTAIVIGAGILLATGATTVVVQHVRANESGVSDTDSAWRRNDINSGDVVQLPPEVKILPSKFKLALFSAGTYVESSGGKKFVGIKGSVSRIVATAYSQRRGRMIFAIPEPSGSYDFIGTLEQGSREALQQELKRQFALTARHEMIVTNVLVLKQSNPKAPGIHPPEDGEYCYMHTEGTQIEIKWAHERISKIMDFLEDNSPMPIVDQTGSSGDCSIDIEWDEDLKDPTHQALQNVLREQLGLELMQTNMPMDMLVVEKAK